MKKEQVNYDILGVEAPVMPENIPDVLKLATKNVPAHMRPAVMNSIFPALGALMHNVGFRYTDNVYHEPHFMCGMVGPMSVGKGSIEPVIQTIIHTLLEHDKMSEAKLTEWKQQYKMAGANKQKPARPEDAAILVPQPDMTNPALIQLLMDAEREGNRFLYTNIPEVDLLDQCSGGHKKVTRVIRLAYDLSKLGAQRATVEGISGSPTLRWNFNFSCVESKAIKFFKDTLDDGTMGRIGFSYVQRPKDRLHMPKQGKYDQAYQQQLDAYLIRLTAATGEIACKQANVLAEEIRNELSNIGSLGDDEIFDGYSFRSTAIGWLKACVLYVANGCKWTSSIAEFMRWSVYYDLWSKYALFAQQLRVCGSTVDTTKTKQSGPINMLLYLKDTFTKGELEVVRMNDGKPKHGMSSQLYEWKQRGYIIENEDGTYSKTESGKLRV